MKLTKYTIEYMPLYGNGNGNEFNTLLSYRLKLEISGDDLFLIKEYFKTGFHDGECWDDWWICKGYHYINWVSIITRNFDEKYLKELEIKIFEMFYDASEKMVDEINEDLLKSITTMNKQLSKQKEITKFAETFNRRRKLKNINKIK